jgi:hypothetical protein
MIIFIIIEDIDFFSHIFSKKKNSNYDSFFFFIFHTEILTKKKFF